MFLPRYRAVASGAAASGGSAVAQRGVAHGIDGLLRALNAVHMGDVDALSTHVQQPKDDSPIVFWGTDD